MTSKNTNLMLLLAFSGIIGIMLAAMSIPGNANAQNYNATTTQSTNATMVSVGKGNLTVSYNQFYPQDVQINAGESVTFVNPTPELHSVIFDFSNGTIFSDVVLPFTVSGNPEIELQEPFNLGEPMLETDENGTQTLITLNKIVFVPSAVDESGNVQYLNGTDISYTATGNEDVISSGILMPTEEELEAMFMAAFPEEMMEHSADNATATEEEEFEPVTQDVNKFTVTFEEPGTYEYFCPFHPAMYGQINVN